MTKKRTRISRPQPARTAPIRDFSTILQADQPRSPDGNPGRPANEGSANTSPFDAVAHGARLGYSVIQEQLRQGRRVAQQWGQVSRGPEATDNEIGRLMQRVLHFSTDVSALLVEVAEMVMRAPHTNGGDTRSAPASVTEPAKNGANTHISVEIEAAGRSKVTLDLNGHAANGKLTVPGLYALDGESAPITQISFEMQVLQIRIPDGQPAGTYTGVVVDRETNEPKGTLSIQLSR